MRFLDAKLPFGSNILQLNSHQSTGMLRIYEWVPSPGASLRIRELLSEFPGYSKRKAQGMGKTQQWGMFTFPWPLGIYRCPLPPPFILPSASILLPEGSPGPLAVQAGRDEEEAKGDVGCFPTWKQMWKWWALLATSSLGLPGAMWPHDQAWECCQELMNHRLSLSRHLLHFQLQARWQYIH